MKIQFYSWLFFWSIQWLAYKFLNFRIWSFKKLRNLSYHFGFLLLLFCFVFSLADFPAQLPLRIENFKQNYRGWGKRSVSPLSHPDFSLCSIILSPEIGLCEMRESTLRVTLKGDVAWTREVLLCPALLLISIGVFLYLLVPIAHEFATD